MIVTLPQHYLVILIKCKVLAGLLGHDHTENRKNLVLVKKNSERFFKPLSLLPRGKAFLLKTLMVPNILLTRAYGLENLKGIEGATIYALNHNNSLETVMVPTFLIYHLDGRCISFVIDWMYSKIPVLGFLMNMTDPIYVYNKRSSLPWIEAIRPPNPSHDTVERCTEKLRAGLSIGIFPEGKRNKNPDTLLKGKPGIGHIALQTGATVVPVGIDFECRTTKGKIPVLGKTIVRIGKPMRFQEQSDAYNALMPSAAYSSKKTAERHFMAAHVTREIMICLAELSGKRYSDPYTEKINAFSLNTI